MRKAIQLFEYDTLKVNQPIAGGIFDQNMLTAFEVFYGEKGVPYYTLIRNGVKFNQFVGAIQVGELLVEVLPKIDKTAEDTPQKWQARLVDMLRVSGVFDFDVPSSSTLSLKENTILDLYIALFVQEVEYLLHLGLVKKYRPTAGNTHVLKGSLQFSQHIQQNIVHQERFYVRHTVYDIEHTLHFILYKALRLLQKINTQVDLQSKIGALLLHFPEMPDMPITEATFDKLVLNRKTAHYQKAIEIAKLLLLNYYPDLRQGQHHVLALMFDMNILWEKFVYASLQKYNTANMELACQDYKGFWYSENGYKVGMKPDIVINKGKENCTVLDTKWKNLDTENAKPSPDDLRQMYVYHTYYDAKKVALVYPTSETEHLTKGNYLQPTEQKECSLLFLPAEENITDWQKSIAQKITDWLEKS